MTERNKKVAIYTEIMGSVCSGGIRCIVYFLNMLIDKGYECVCFVDRPPYDSTWLPSKFKVFPSSEVERYDGILISPYTPTAATVSQCKNALERIYWVHIPEFTFIHNGPKWVKMSVESYKLKNIHFMCTSHYVQIMLELAFNQKVLPYRVPGGVDKSMFRFDESIYKQKIKSEKVIFIMLNRHEPMRGFDIGEEAFSLLQKEYGDKVELKIFGGIPQQEMYKHYCSSHFFLGPSRAEGLPLPPLEAMACGCIPIVTHFGTQDYVIDNQNGFFVNANDVKHTYEIMKKCADMYFKSLKIKKNNEYESTMYDMISCVSRITIDDWGWNRMIDGFENNMKYLGH